MKIEANKFYKTRDGQKVRIYAIDGAHPFPVHGANLLGSEWVQQEWCAEGSFYLHEKDGLDIVGEWEEPKPRMLAYRHRHTGEVYLAPEGQTPHPFPGDYVRAPWLDEPEESSK